MIYIFARNCIPFCIYILNISGLNIRDAVFPPGWVEGIRLSDGERGWFPKTYVKEITSRSARLRNLRENIRIKCVTQKLKEDHWTSLHCFLCCSALDLHLKVTHTLAVNTFRKLEHHINIQQFHSLSWMIKCFASLPKSSFRFPQFCFKSFCHRLYYQNTHISGKTWLIKRFSLVYILTEPLNAPKQWADPSG